MGVTLIRNQSTAIDGTLWNSYCNSSDTEVFDVEEGLNLNNSVVLVDGFRILTLTYPVLIAYDDGSQQEFAGRIVFSGRDSQDGTASSLISGNAHTNEGGNQCNCGFSQETCRSPDGTAYSYCCGCDFKCRDLDV